MTITILIIVKNRHNTCVDLRLVSVVWRLRWNGRARLQSEEEEDERKKRKKNEKTTTLGNTIEKLEIRRSTVCLDV